MNLKSAVRVIFAYVTNHFKAGACSSLFVKLKNINESSIKNPSYSGDQGIRVKSFLHRAYVEPICIVDNCLYCNLNLRNVMQRLKHLEQQINNNNRYVTKHSNRDLLDLLESKQVL